MRTDLIKKRKEKGYTQKGLAEVIGVSRTAISAWELGRNEPPLKIIIKLKQVLDIDDDSFFLLDNDTKRQQTA